MKKITMFTAIFACAGVFGQQQVAMIGTNNPIVFETLENNTMLPEEACSEENPNDMTFENGFNVSSAVDFKTANDITVAADEDFTLTNITASIFANGGISSVDVTYYDNAGSLPGAVIGSENSVTIDSQTVIGTNFGLDVNEVKLSVAPFTFLGQAGSTKTYWIQLTVTDSGSTGSVFWVVTNSSMIGNPTALFDGGWAVADPLSDGVYIWEGECNALGVNDSSLSGFNFYPNPTNSILKLNAAKNIDSVSFYNLLGQKLLDLNVNAMTSEMDLQSLAMGTYIMRVNIDGESNSFNIIKD